MPWFAQQHLFVGYLCSLLYFLLFYKHEWKMEKYDSSEKHRFKKETILHAESNGSLTLV